MIAKTKDKKEQGDMMIAAAKKFQQEHDGKLPSVMDVAHQLDTSQWTIYHNSYYMEWMKQAKMRISGLSDAKSQPALKNASQPVKKETLESKNSLMIHGTLLYPWTFQGELVVRSAEMEKCLSHQVRSLVKACAKQDASCMRTACLQELWDENPGCKRTGNPVFPVSLYVEAAFHAALQTKKLQPRREKELKEFIQSYFHAGPAQEEAADVQDQGVQTDGAQDPTLMCVPAPALDLTPLIDCISHGFQALETFDLKHAENVAGLYIAIREQNKLLTQAVELLSQNLMIQGQAITSLQDTICSMVQDSNPVNAGSVSTATAKILNRGEQIQETDKKALLEKKLQSASNRKVTARTSLDTEAFEKHEAAEETPDIDTGSDIPDEAPDMGTGPDISTQETPVSKKASSTIPEEGQDSDFMSFRVYSDQIHALLLEFGITNKMDTERGAMLSKAYTRMRNQYGIVWEQVEKEYIQENGDRAKSTLRLAYFLESTGPQYRGLLGGCLYTVLQDAAKKHEEDTSSKAEQYYVQDLGLVDEMIEKLAIEKSVTPRSLKDAYHMLLQNDTTMHWKRLSTAYREKFRMASKCAIDPIKVAGSTDKAKKRAVVLFNMFVDKQFMDVTA